MDRPSYEDRRKCSILRAAEKEAKKSLKKPRESEGEFKLRKEVEALRKQVKELEEERTIMKAKEAHLTRQLFRIENMKNDSSQLEYFSGLSRVVWDCVWKFLKPSEDNILNERRQEECMRDMP